MAWPILLMRLEEKYRKWPGAKRINKNGNAFEVVSLLAESHWANNRTSTHRFLLLQLCYAR